MSFGADKRHNRPKRSWQLLCPVTPCNSGGATIWASLYSRVSGGRSSVGRAPDCDSGGRGFKPRRPPQLVY